MAIIKCENLTLGYEGTAIINNLNFHVESGEYLCIVGENGSGKSTLMKTLLKLRTPMSGSVLLSDGLEQQDIGYLPQQTEVQRDFPAKVKEIVLSGCQSRKGFHPFYTAKDKALAVENMERMSILDLKERSYKELSGGQQQRVLLARALCAARKVLLLDEPVAGLDPVVTEQMYELIDELNKKDGITIIMISHDMHAAMKYASNILYIADEVFFGTKKQFKEQDIFNRYILGKED